MELDTLGVPGEYWVKFLVYLLKGAAQSWWEIMAQTHDTNNVTWEQFVELFKENYINADHDKAIRE